MGATTKALDGAIAEISGKAAALQLDTSIWNRFSERSLNCQQPTRIADYRPTSGKAVQHLVDITGKQLGDPILGAQPVVKAIAAGNPPLHLVLGEVHCNGYMPISKH